MVDQVPETRSLDLGINLNPIQVAFQGSGGYSPLDPTKNMASGAVTPHYIRSIALTDSKKIQHTLQVGFLKTSDNTWAAELFIAPGSDIKKTGLPNAQLAHGNIEFNADGTLNDISQSLFDKIKHSLSEINVDWTNGASPSKVSIDWGTPGTFSGLTQLPGQYQAKFVSFNRRMYDGTTFESLTEINSKPGSSVNYEENKMGHYERDAADLVVLKHDDPKDKITVTTTTDPKTKVVSINYTPVNLLQIDLSLLPSSAEFATRQVNAKYDDKGNAVNGDLAIDIFIPEANSRKTIVMKNQFDASNNGAGVNSVVFLKGVNSNEQAGGASLINIYQDPPQAVKIPFDQFKTQFEAEIQRLGGKIKEPTSASISKPEPEFVRLARASFAGSNGGLAPNEVSAVSQDEKIAGKAA